MRLGNPVSLAEEELPPLSKRKVLGSSADDDEVRLWATAPRKAGQAWLPSGLPARRSSAVIADIFRRPYSLIDQPCHRSVVDRVVLRKGQRWSVRKAYVHRRGKRPGAGQVGRYASVGKLQCSNLIDGRERSMNPRFDVMSLFVMAAHLSVVARKPIAMRSAVICNHPSNLLASRVYSPAIRILKHCRTLGSFEESAVWAAQAESSWVDGFVLLNGHSRIDDVVGVIRARKPPH